MFAMDGDNCKFKVIYWLICNIIFIYSEIDLTYGEN